MKSSRSIVRTLVHVGAAVVCATALNVAPAGAHNTGCVITGNGGVVTVGSGKSAPLVPEQNPNYRADDDGDGGRLDLVDGPGNQYGARFAADQGNSAVLAPRNC